MPYSSTNGKQEIQRIVSTVKHEKMLDIGCGVGTYAKLFPDAEWTGVEVWEPYVEKYSLHDLYNTLIIGDAREWEPFDQYDVAFAGDVLEHMTYEEAKALIKKLQACSETVIASIPIGHWPQGEYEGNPYERHVKDDWTDEEARSLFTDPVLGGVYNRIGVYAWSKSGQLFKSIPRTIHIVWIGDEKKRPDDLIQTWIDKNPSWEVKVWGNEELHGVNWENSAHIQTYLEQKQYNGVADMMRYEILYTHGGFAVDADSECVAPLEDWLFCNSACAPWENEVTRPNLIAMGYMASAAGHPLFKEIIEAIKNDPTIPDGPAWIKTGPVLFTEVYKKHPENVHVWPSHYFIPEHYTGVKHEGKGPIFAHQKWMTTLNTYRENIKVAVYAIAKNEEKHVQRFIESAKGADYIVIADTGSTDKTVEIARACGATVHPINIDPWRFDHARNAALALVPSDAKVCIALDLDEVLEPNWRDVIERLWTPGTGRIRYKQDWGSGHIFYAEKIHARTNYEWRFPIHEYIIPISPEKIVRHDDILIRHQPDTEKSRGQYLPLLEKATKENPTCHRMAYYYARELFYYGKWEKCIAEATRYLDLPTAHWGHERVYMMRILGKANKALDKGFEAQRWFRRACAEVPTLREPWVDLAQACYDWGLWLECYSAAMHAVHITERNYLHTSDPACWGAKPHDLASIAAWNLGFKEISLTQARLALEKAPDNERLQNNLKIVEKALSCSAQP
jgi:mannosyltransferase OCH1-like enzyme